MKVLVCIFAFLTVFTSSDGLSCRFPCPLYFKSICGSDGVTYGNECFMRGAACLQKKAIVTVHDGKCKEENDEYRCLFPCTMDYQPVCGSDGHQYSNECALRAESCRRREPITIVQEGQVDCSKCNNVCSQDYNPVCGSDGNTYSNKCTMTFTACKTKTAIIAVRESRCSP